MSIRCAPLFVAFAVLAGAVAGCAQTAGETCQLDEDCEGDLICCKTSSSVSARGTCEERCTAVAVDAGPEEDAGTEPDAGTEEDAGTEPDAGTEDAGPEDAGPEDAGPEDAGPEDAGPEDAGETDAGEPDAS